MAKTLFKLTIVIFLLITLSLHCQMAFSTDIGDEEDYYELDTPLPHFISRSRFLATAIKKEAHCNPNANNICNGVSANKGTELLQYCKHKCVDVLGDMNNCGLCGKKCKQGERCCNGICTNILHNVNNCGKCNKKCKPGIHAGLDFVGMLDSYYNVGICSSVLNYGT